VKSESSIKADIVKYLRLRGFLVWKLSDRFRSGVPDIYCARAGRSYWFEIKTEIGKVSPLQEYDLRDLRAHGVTAAVIRSVDDVKASLHSEAKGE